MKIKVRELKRLVKEASQRRIPIGTREEIFMTSGNDPRIREMSPAQLAAAITPQATIGTVLRSSKGNSQVVDVEEDDSGLYLVVEPTDQEV